MKRTKINRFFLAFAFAILTLSAVTYPWVASGSADWDFRNTGLHTDFYSSSSIRLIDLTFAVTPCIPGPYSFSVNGLTLNGTMLRFTVTAESIDFAPTGEVSTELINWVDLDTISGYFDNIDPITASKVSVKQYIPYDSLAFPQRFVRLKAVNQPPL